MHPLTTLICGNHAREGTTGQVLSHLADTLDRLLVHSKKLQNAGDEIDLSLFGPWLARATIEVSFTALLSRFDPFRILSIRRSQLSNSYDPKDRNRLAFNWSFDVKGEDKIKDWDQKPAATELQRALLCKHFNDVFWEEAFTTLLDSVPIHKGGSWMTRLKRIYPEGFTSFMRTEADHVYSALSKGVHHEFVIPVAAQYDVSTVKDLMSRSWELAAALGLTTSFSPAVKALLTVDPVVLYEEAQKELYT